MKALDFLHSKGIEMATCYTNKDTYYVKELGSLIEEYARIQIEKDRERVKAKINEWGITSIAPITIIKDIDNTPINLD